MVVLREIVTIHDLRRQGPGISAVAHDALPAVERRISRDGVVSVAGNLQGVPDATRRRVVEVMFRDGRQEEYERIRKSAEHSQVAILIEASEAPL